MREGDRRGGEEGEMRKIGEFVGKELGISRWNDWERRKKWGILGGGELAMMIIHEEGEREKMEGLLVM